MHTRGIDDVYGIRALFTRDGMRSVPVTEGRGTLDSNALFALEFHAVHLGTHSISPSHLTRGSRYSLAWNEWVATLGFTTTYLMDIADPSSVVKDALRQGRLP